MSFYSMIKFVILITMIQNISFTNALYPSLCGLKFKDKVIGGTEVESNSWPWMVSIHYNFQHICGGTLINNEFILTAAHCILYPSAVSAYKVVLGGHNISEVGVNTNAVRLGLSKIIVHEDFYQPYYLNDVALLKLHKPVEFSREIFPACMPSNSDNFENTICHFIGWGYTHPSGNVPNTPKEITLPILSQEECIKYAFAAVEQKYCSGAMGSYQDTCKGDSGGGQMCVKSDGRWYVGGIVSYGAGACGNVGIQARVDYQRRWIDKNVAENSS